TPPGVAAQGQIRQANPAVILGQAAREKADEAREVEAGEAPPGGVPPPAGGLSAQPPRRRGPVVRAADSGRAFVPNGGRSPSYTMTRTRTSSMAQWPDLRKGRGIGWACPFSSIARQRNV